MRFRRRVNSRVTAAIVLAGLVMLAAPVAAESGSRKHGSNRGHNNRISKLDGESRSRASKLFGTSRVIITLKPGADERAVQEVRKLGGRLGRKLRLVDGIAVEVPNRVIQALSERSEVISIHYDRPAVTHMNRAAVAVGARAAQQAYGYSGAGVGVAVIDSGITPWHDDLGDTGSSSSVRVVNGQRLTAFVDFVNGATTAYDDNGHGTHVAGIIAGNGYDTYGSRAGIAPSAHIVSLKVLDREGRGVISDVIAAFEWAIANRAAHNIRVINLSVGARVSESYTTDPLTLAAKRAVDAGIIVVAAAGNLGQRQSLLGNKTQYGGITAPGNAPWVLTVGAYSTEGTVNRWDDKIAPYSSRGPGAIDHAAKPDLVAPGTGIVSLSSPSSLFYQTKVAFLLNGSRDNTSKTYLSLSGTSMAAPVVAGTVAMMLQANPTLTPNLVKGILQYTAQTRHYDALTQGAGFLNTQGAVELARHLRYAQPGARYPHSWMWSRQIIWGNRRLKGGVIKPSANAWALDIVWGTNAGEDDNENIVWGTLCPETDSDCENIVWGTAEDIVWGTADDEENIVWGTAMNMEDIVWGTFDNSEDIVWGTNLGFENIVWGTSGIVNDIVWGTAGDGEDVTWGSNDEDAHLFDDPALDPVNYDLTTIDQLFMPPPPPPSPPPPTSGGSVGGILGGGL